MPPSIHLRLNILKLGSVTDQVNSTGNNEEELYRYYCLPNSSNFYKCMQPQMTRSSLIETGLWRWHPHWFSSSFFQWFLFNFLCWTPFLSNVLKCYLCFIPSLLSASFYTSFLLDFMDSQNFIQGPYAYKDHLSRCVYLMVWWLFQLGCPNSTCPTLHFSSLTPALLFVHHSFLLLAASLASHPYQTPRSHPEPYFTSLLQSITNQFPLILLPNYFLDHPSSSFLLPSWFRACFIIFHLDYSHKTPTWIPCLVKV